MLSRGLFAVVAAFGLGVVIAADDASPAVWLERHNYFRMSALPYAAANMQQLTWSAALATTAANDAKSCGAASGTGVNAIVSDAALNASAVDFAMNAWVVKPALQVISTLTAPRPGDGVGIGKYSTYSQVVWAATNTIGCAQAACPNGKTAVVCRYEPAGNDGSSAWYMHDTPASACPAGTTGKVGLCVKNSATADPASDPSTIPAGQHAYEVFSDFIPAVLKEVKGQVVTVSDTTAPTSSSAATTTATTATTTAPSSAAADASPATVKPSDASGAGTASTSPQGVISFTSPNPTPNIVTNTAPSTAGGAGGPATSSGKNTSSNSGTTKTDALANNKSSVASTPQGFSVAVLVGVIVVACILVAVIMAFVSYRRNQEHQQRIQLNHGIRVLD